MNKIRSYIRLDNFFKVLGVASFAMGYSNYLHREKLESIRQRLEFETARRIKLEEQNIELLEKWKNSLENCQEFTSRFIELTKKANILNNKIRTTNENIEILNSKQGVKLEVNSLDLTDANNITDCSNEIVDNFHKFNNELEKLIELGRKSVDSLQSVDYLNNFEPLDSIREIISLLTYDQLIAFIHLSGVLTIALCIFSIILIFYSEKLIVYFKIEEKFPRFGKIVKLRRKFQNYYFIINVSIIIFILIGIAHINLNTLLNL